MGSVKKRWIISMSGWIPTLASRECQGFRGLCKDGGRGIEERLFTGTTHRSQ